MSEPRERRKRDWPVWFGVAMAILPVLYVLSSGPMQTVAFRGHVTQVGSAPGPIGVDLNIDPGTWWPRVYAPLLWASDKSWGEPINWYWSLFPIRETIGVP